MKSGYGLLKHTDCRFMFLKPFINGFEILSSVLGLAISKIMEVLDISFNNTNAVKESII
jgi:hypothetical protein